MKITHPIRQSGELLTKTTSGEGKDIYRFVVNTDIINRNGWKTLSEGISTTDFLKSPVLLLNHDDYNFPIGKVVGFELANAKHSGKQLIADVVFHEESEESRLAKKLVDLGIMTSTSIRIRPTEQGEPIQITEQLRKIVPAWVEKVEVYTKSDLREISLVNIPANTGARIKEKIKSAYEDKKLSEQEFTLAAAMLHEENETQINNMVLCTNEGTDMSFEIENVGLKKDIEILQASNKAFEADKKQLEGKLTAVTDELEKLKTVSAATAAELNAAKEALAAKEKENAGLLKQNFENEEKMYCEKLQREGKLPPNEVAETVADLVTMRQMADSDKEDSLYKRNKARLDKRTAILPQGEMNLSGEKPGVFTLRDIERSRETAEAFAEICEEKAAKEGKTFMEIYNREINILKGGA